MLKKVVTTIIFSAMILIAATVAIETEAIDDVQVNTLGFTESAVTQTVSITPIRQGTYDCEATALSMLLAHYDSSIRYSEVTNASSAYSGWASNQYGAMLYITLPNVIRLANSILSSHNSELTTVDLSGSTLENLYARLDAGHPTFVIYSTNTSYPQTPSLATIDNGYYVYDDTHAIVLCGYNTSSDQVQIADPATGSLYWISSSSFATIWNMHGNYAMGINYPTTNVSITKKWNDDNDRDGIRPSTSAFAGNLRLYANGTAVSATPQITANGNNYTVTYKDVPKANENGNIVYRVGEATVPNGYIASVSQVAANGSITNTHACATTTVSAKILWNDNDNADGKRPASVNVWLVADGIRTSTNAVLDESNNWTATFQDVNTYRNGGTAISYSVEEDVPSGYSQKTSGSQASGYTITNTHESDTINISVSKNWIGDSAADRPANVAFTIIENGVATSHKIMLSAADNWSGVFEKLPKNRNGSPISYSVEEEVPEGYTSQRAGDIENGFVFTNIKTISTRNISVSLSWNDDDDRDGVRPENATVWLVANGTRTSVNTVLSNGSWSGSFNDLDLSGAEGDISYSVEMDAPEGYNVAISGDQETGFSLKCVHEPAKAPIAFSVLWDDANNQDGIRPSSLDLTLVADEEPTSVVCSAKESSSWAGTSPIQYVYHNGGTAISYSFAVTAPTGYEVKVEKGSSGVVVTCLHKPNSVSLNVSASWDDDGDRDGLRPQNIDAVLLANGIPTSTTISLKASDNWSGTFANLPANDSGSPVAYSVSVQSPANYTATVNGDVQNGYTIVFSHKPATASVAISISWEDDDNRDGIRPQSIEATLVADGVELPKKISLDASKNWTGSFDDVVKYSNGSEISYTVSIATPARYIASTVGNSNEYTVVLKHTSESMDVSGVIAWSDDNDRDGVRPESIDVTLLSNGKDVDTYRATDSNGWRYTFSNLPLKANNQNVSYQVKATIGNYKVSTTETGLSATHVPIMIKIPIAIDWNGADGIDSIEASLYDGSGSQVSSLVLSAAENWKGSFAPVYANEKGKSVEYSAKASIPEGYSGQVIGNAASGFVIELVEQNSGGSSTQPADDPSQQSSTQPVSDDGKNAEHSDVEGESEQSQPKPSNEYLSNQSQTEQYRNSLTTSNQNSVEGQPARISSTGDVALMLIGMIGITAGIALVIIRRKR